MEFCTIASGSSGNSTYIGTEYTKILIDAGVSGKRGHQRTGGICRHRPGTERPD